MVQEVMLCYFSSTTAYFTDVQDQNVNRLCGDKKDS